MNRSTVLKVSVLVLLAVTFSSCKLGRFMAYNFADIKDYKKFSSRPLVSNETKFQFHSTDNGAYPDTIKVNDSSEWVTLDEFLEMRKTVAFVIIKNDTIQYENYFSGYDEQSIIPSFSMAKSLTSILIGCAIDDGLIKSVDEPVTNYLPYLAENGFEMVTIEHVLQMTTALDFNESYVNPFGHAASFYYGRNLEREVSKLDLKGEPGADHEYVSGNTQLLGMILTAALKDKTITDYFQEKIWTPLEMEYDASWSIDKKKEGVEKTFCCVNARARDFAKIGRLYLNKGNWNGVQIVSEEWVSRSTQIDTTNGSVEHYQYQWWIPSESGDFMAVGILGQYIYVDPARDVVIVRMGKKGGGVSWADFFQVLSKYTDR